MGRSKKPRYIPFKLTSCHQWAVLDRETSELVDEAGDTEKLPESWARTRADQLNKESDKKNQDQE